jgi:hypothetical protein
MLPLKARVLGTTREEMDEGRIRMPQASCSGTQNTSASQDFSGSLFIRTKSESVSA